MFPSHDRGSKYDIAKGATPESYTAIVVDTGGQRPDIDPTNIGASNTAIQVDGRRRQVVATDANFSSNVTTSGTEVWHTGTLTADRSVSLSTTSAVIGDQIRFTRTGGGAFNLNVGTGPLKAPATNTWCIVEYTGSAWALKAYGTL